ncbi:hypothetical protein SRHO_G00193680 [Serrasalmus rhombeus]
MFSKQDTPYAAAAPARVKCVAKYMSTRAESFEVVDGVLAMKSSRLVAACALSDRECGSSLTLVSSLANVFFAVIHCIRVFLSEFANFRQYYRVLFLVHRTSLNQTLLFCTFITDSAVLCAFIAACRLYPVQLVSLLGAEGTEHRGGVTALCRDRRAGLRDAEAAKVRPGIVSQVVDAVNAHVTAVVASHAQDDLRYDGFSRGVQCTCNSLGFLAVLGENDRLNGLDLNRVLAKGDALYTRVKRALLNEGRFVIDVLTFDELPGTVETDSRCYSVIKHPQRFGFLEDEAPQGMAEYETLDRALRCLTGDAATALLLTGATCIAVFRDRAGRFGFFDPHCRTPDGLTAAEHMGTAVMLTFANLEDLIERLLILYQACLELNDSQQHDLLPVSIVNRDTATTADAQGKLSFEIQTIVDSGSSLRYDLCQSEEQSMAKLNKTQRRRQYLHQKHTKKKEQSIQTEEKKTGINQKNRYASDLKFREKMIQRSRVNYTENVNYRVGKQKSVISLPKGQQRAIKGAVVSVPSDVETIANILPRPRSESQLLTVKLKR